MTTTDQIIQLIDDEYSMNGNRILDACVTIAHKQGFPPHQIMAMYPNKNNPNQSMLDLLEPHRWPRMQREALDSDCKYMSANIIQPDLLIGKIARSIAGAVQFPENTAFAHALGVVASALCPNFTFSVDSKQMRLSKKPVTLYVCTAQPPSTGKSFVNGQLMRPIDDAYVEINKQRALESLQCQLQIKEFEAQLKNDKGSSEAKVNKEMEIINIKKRIASLGEISAGITDATPEALEIAAIHHGGFVNVVSAEAESITVAIGGLYSEGKSGNMGILLSMWDGQEKVSAKRASREAYSGYIKGCFATISQDEGVNALMEAARSGRGIGERFLIMREPTALGFRDLSKTTPINAGIYDKYSRMIDNVINDKDVELTFDQDCFQIVLEYRQKLEPEMANDGKFSDDMLRGVIGKADMQIFRIASVLHVSEHWGKVPKSRPTQIDPRMVARAILIFDQFKEYYVAATSERGMAGEVARLNEMIEAMDHIKNQAKRRRNKISLREFRASAIFGRKSSIIGKRGDATESIKVLLVRLMDMGFCAFDGRDITINPNL